MTSWVRYSLAVYFGLLLAGALMVDRQQASARAPEWCVPARPEHFKSRISDPGTTAGATPEAAAGGLSAPGDNRPGDAAAGFR